MKTRFFPGLQGALQSSRLLVGSITMMLGFSSAQAATLTWDSDTGTSGAQDGAGTWAAGGLFFWDGSSDVATTNDLVTDIAQFGNGDTLASAATVNVDTQSINGLSFGATTTSGYNLTNGSASILTLGGNGIAVNLGAQATTLGSANLSLALGAAQTWTNNSANAVTISGAVSGAFNLTKAGTGTLILSGTNTYTGTTTINAGTLISASTTGLGAVATNTASFTGGTTGILDLQTDGAGDIAYKISMGSGSIGTIASDVKTGSVGINHTLGTSNLAAATLNITKGLNVLSGTPSITMGAVTLSAGTAGAITILNPTTANLFLSSVTTSGATTGTKVLQLDGTIAGNTISGVISKGSSTALAVTKTNTSTWTLSGASTYTGATTISAGTLKAGVASVANTSGAFGNNSAVSFADAASAIMDITGFNTQVGSLTGGGASGGNIVLGAATLTTGGDNTSPAAYVGIISGTGMQILSGANSYTGATTVSAGTLALGSGGSLAATNVTVSSGATFAAAPGVTGATSSTGGNLTLSAGGKFSMADGATSTLTVAGTASLGGANTVLTLDLGGTTTAADRLTVTGAVTNAAGGKITINGTGTTAPTAGPFTIISGASGVNTNALTLSTNKVSINNTAYPLTLATSATSATITVGSTGSLDQAYWTGAKGANWSTTASGTNWNTSIAGGVDASAQPTALTDVFFTTSSPTAMNSASSVDVAYAINSLSFTAGASAQTIGGPGLLTINGSAGTGISVAVGSAAQTVNAPITLGASQTWTNSSTNTLTIGSAITGAGKLLSFGGPGTIQLNGSLNNVSTNSGVNSGATLISSGGASLTAVFLNSGTMTINGGNFSTSGQFTVVAGTLNVSTGGTLTQTVSSLQLSNSGTSTTNLNGGTINASAAASVLFGHVAGKSTLNLNSGEFDTKASFSHDSATSGNVVNFAGATVKLFASLTDLIDPARATRFTLNNVGGGGGAVIDTNGNSLGIAEVINHTGAGADGGLTKLGLGALTLSAANTYNGNTIVSGGTLELALAGALKFVPTTNGVSNKITGAGTLMLKGAFNIDTTAANTTLGNSWTLVDVGTLSETFDPSFSVSGFTESSNVWTKPDGANVFTFTEATGVLTYSAAGGFSSWIAGFPVGGQNQPGDDFDKDGLSNLLEYALNGDPSVSNTSILPQLVVTATDFEFTYSRLDLSLADTVQSFQYGSDLTGWTPILIPAGTGVSTVGIATVTIADTGSTDSVKVSIPKSAAAGGKLFGRLQIVK